MHEPFHINLLDIKLIIIILASTYIYLRKKLRTFFNLSIALFVFMICAKYAHITGGVRTIVFAVLLCFVFIASFKEIFAIEKSGMTAHQALKPDKYDLIVFIFLLSVWFVAKSIWRS